jgi:pyruvate/2-oxoglutarate/acetoin dehydrogenase E1 component
MPATPYDAKGLLKTAIRSDDLILFIEHKMLYKTKGEVPDEEYTIPLGKAAVRREGSDVTVVSYSMMANRSLGVCEKLAEEEGIDAEVIDLRCLKPLDMPTVIESVKKTGHVVLVSEGCRNANVVCEIAMRINEFAFDYLDAPVVRVCAADTPVPMSPTLEDAMVPNEERIAAGIRQAVA